MYSAAEKILLGRISTREYLKNAFKYLVTLKFKAEHFVVGKCTKYPPWVSVPLTEETIAKEGMKLLASAFAGALYIYYHFHEKNQEEKRKKEFKKLLKEFGKKTSKQMNDHFDASWEQINHLMDGKHKAQLCQIDVMMEEKLDQIDVMMEEKLRAHMQRVTVQVNESIEEKLAAYTKKVSVQVKNNEVNVKEDGEAIKDVRSIRA